MNPHKKQYYTILFFFFFSITSVFCQANRYYQRNSFVPQYSSPDVSAIGAALCHKQLQIDIDKANTHIKYCLNNETKSFTNIAELEHSSWLSVAGSFKMGGQGYSMVVLKNESVYYFNYIPESILSQWQNSSSPGEFYSSYIRNQYNLSRCGNYAP